MKKNNLNYMTKGWIVGDFSPSIINTKKCEIAIKHYKKGDSEPAHYHKEAEEITVIVNGKVLINDLILNKNDIVLVEKNEVVKFKALEDSTTVVYKSKSIKDDKYIVDCYKLKK